MSKNKEEWKVTYKQLGIVIFSFVLGFVVANIVFSSQVSTTTNFSTTELVGFLLSVMLSAASIVLAIAAIVLGKSSEKAVIDRSDESIRLQTDLFTKTTDALQSIKASTGVTEKRIEDILRSGELTTQLAEIARDETSSGRVDTKELEERIRTSLLQSLTPSRPLHLELPDPKVAARRRERERSEAEYYKSHDQLMYGIANKEHVKVIKIGHATPGLVVGERENAYDGLFEKEGKKIAVSTIRPTQSLRDIKMMIGALAGPLKKSDIERLFIIFFEKDGDEIDQDREEAAREQLDLYAEEVRSKITVSWVRYSNIDKWVSEVEV